MSAEGLVITVGEGEASLKWTDLEVLEMDQAASGADVVILAGPRSGRLELELLQPNAVAREGKKKVVQLFATLERIRQEAKAAN